MNIRGCTTALLQLISAVGLLFGVLYFISAITTPGNYRMYDASAVQATQVYSEALYYAALSISSFLFGIFLQLAMYFGGYYRQPKLESIEFETITIRNTLNKVGRMLQQQANGQSGNGELSARKPTADKSGMRALLDRDESEF